MGGGRGDGGAGAGGMRPLSLDGGLGSPLFVAKVARKMLRNAKMSLLSSIAIDLWMRKLSGVELISAMRSRERRLCDNGCVASIYPKHRNIVSH